MLELSELLDSKVFSVYLIISTASQGSSFPVCSHIVFFREALGDSIQKTSYPSISNSCVNSLETPIEYKLVEKVFLLYHNIFQNYIYMFQIQYIKFQQNILFFLSKQFYRMRFLWFMRSNFDKSEKNINTIKQYITTSSLA